MLPVGGLWRFGRIIFSYTLIWETQALWLGKHKHTFLQFRFWRRSLPEIPIHFHFDKYRYTLTWVTQTQIRFWRQRLTLWLWRQSLPEVPIEPGGGEETWGWSQWSKWSRGGDCGAFNLLVDENLVASRWWWCWCPDPGWTGPDPTDPLEVEVTWCCIE